MANDILAALISAALVSFIAVMLVLTLRLPMRKLFGASQAYALWSLVPLSLAATLLPSPGLQHVIMPGLTAAAPIHALQRQAQAALPQYDWQAPALVAWLAGSLLLLLRFYLQHRRFIRKLGRLDTRSGLHYAEDIDSGPALIGVWMPKIVVPGDFDQRYSNAEKALIVAHERTHIQRGDIAANVLCALLQCQFWFNPLVHLAARCFRFDQELACDAAVIRKHPAARRTYADAMLKTHLAELVTPIGCYWHSRHPLKERIMQLNVNMPRTLRRVCGAVLIVSLSLTGTYGAWAAQGKVDQVKNQGDTYRITLNINNKFGTLGDEAKTSIDAPSIIVKENKPVIQLKAGETASIMQSEGNTRMGYDFTVIPVKDDVVELSMIVSKNNEMLEKPRVLIRLDEPGQVSGKFGGNGHLDYSLEFTVSKVIAQSKQ
jgi:beta-lactamase regulating signal transducer with metallopeptidase domain